MAGLAVCVLFLVEFSMIVRGTHTTADAMEKASFASQKVLGLAWSVFFWKEARRERPR